MNVPTIPASRASSLLNGWRMRLSISVKEAAALLEVSDDEYLAFETGDKDTPLKIVKRSRQLEQNPDAMRYLDLPRERWVDVVERAKQINAGEPIVGRLMVNGMWQELRDLMDLARLGPNPQLAITDPKLFVSLREAGTKIYLSGIMEFPLPSPPFDQYPQPKKGGGCQVKP